MPHYFVRAPTAAAAPPALPLERRCLLLGRKCYATHNLIQANPSNCPPTTKGNEPRLPSNRGQGEVNLTREGGRRTVFA